MTCAFDACVSEECPLVGGCVRRRFPSQFAASSKPASDLKKSAPALNGQKPGRASRDPRFIQRKRKVHL